jgi:hypothetical protein
MLKVCVAFIYSLSMGQANFLRLPIGAEHLAEKSFLNPPESDREGTRPTTGLGEVVQPKSLLANL